MRLEPASGELVDAFLTDHGGIHVSQKKASAPQRLRLHHNVKIGKSPRASGRRFSTERCLALPVNGYVDRHSSNQPLRLTERGKNGTPPSTIVLSSAGSAGLHISVATRDI